MRSPSYVVLCMLVMVANLGLLVPAPAIGQTAPERWTLPRTPDGHPDLQGVWANNNATPLERPEAWAGKERLTEEELANLVAAAAGSDRPRTGCDLRRPAGAGSHRARTGDVVRPDDRELQPVLDRRKDLHRPNLVGRRIRWRAGFLPSPTRHRQPNASRRRIYWGTRPTRGRTGRCTSGASRSACRTSGPVTTATITSSRARITL